MNVNLPGLLVQAASCIKPKHDRGAYAFMLEEVAQHVRDVRSGKHTLQEFADFYGIKPDKRPDTQSASGEELTSIPAFPATITKGVK